MREMDPEQAFAASLLISAKTPVPPSTQATELEKRHAPQINEELVIGKTGANEALRQARRRRCSVRSASEPVYRCRASCARTCAAAAPS